MKRQLLVCVLLLSAAAFAQGPPSPGMMPGPGAGKDMIFISRGPGPEHGPMGMGPMGRWWKNSDIVKKVGVSDEQVQKIEQIFQDHRLKLIDVRASLEKEEVRLQPMIEADSPNDKQIMAQIDRVANARAELEKANAQMMLDIRHVLTLDQWKKLQSVQPHGPMPMHTRGAREMGAPGGDGVVTGGKIDGPGPIAIPADPGEGPASQ
jgi:Spy/CpxP family protein refolding chaperone